jgi:chaperonin GroEL
MAAKRILFGGAGRASLLQGVSVLAGAVKATLGPGGRNVFLERPVQRHPLITKDGVTVAADIEVADRFANMGVEMLKEVASKTSRAAGDGTTTATVLAHAIYREGVKMVAAGHHPMEIKRGVERAVVKIVEALKKISRPIRGHEEIARIATISANGDASIGQVVAEGLTKVGDAGIVTVEEGRALETTLEVVEGTEVDKGYLSAHFITDAERQVAVLEDPSILIHEKGISRMRELVPILEQVSRAGRSLLVIGDVEGEALTTLVVNKLRGALKVCAIKPPSYGEWRKDQLKDLAAQTGGRAITEDLGIRLENVTLEDLGRARRVVVDKETATIIGGAAKRDEIEGRAREIRAKREATNSTFDHKQLDDRLARLMGGVGVIRVGAATEPEIREKKARVENALCAARVAVEEGIVPGGGVALLRAQPALARLAKVDGLSEGEAAGVAIVRRACEAPCRHIARNAGQAASTVLQKIRDGKAAYGYNAATGAFEDLVEAGVIDSTKVVRLALQSAASVATLLLTAEAFIAEAPREPVDFPVHGSSADALSMEPFLSRR